LRGPTSEGRGRKKGRGGMGGEGREGEGRTGEGKGKGHEPPPTQYLEEVYAYGLKITNTLRFSSFTI